MFLILKTLILFIFWVVFDRLIILFEFVILIISKILFLLRLGEAAHRFFFLLYKQE